MFRINSSRGEASNNRKNRGNAPTTHGVGMLQIVSEYKSSTAKERTHRGVRPIKRIRSGARRMKQHRVVVIDRNKEVPSRDSVVYILRITLDGTDPETLDKYLIR